MDKRSATIGVLVLAAVTALAGQDPRIDWQFLMPQQPNEAWIKVSTLPDDLGRAQVNVQGNVGVPAPEVAGQTAHPFGAPETLVSLRLIDVPARQVVDELAAKGISFALRSDALPTTKVTIHVQNKPVSQVMAALADALGGSFSNRNGIWVFRPGGDRFLSLPTSVTFAPAMVPNNQRNLTPEQRKRLDEEMKKLRETLERMREDLKRDLGPQAADWLPLTEALAESMPLFMNSSAELARELVRTEAPRAIALESRRVDRVIESLTDDQKRKMTQQGFLRLTDLTPAQREMLGLSLQDKFRIEIRTDKGRLELRND